MVGRGTFSTEQFFEGPIFCHVSLVPVLFLRPSWRFARVSEVSPSPWTRAIDHHQSDVASNHSDFSVACDSHVFSSLSLPSLPLLFLRLLLLRHAWLMYPHLSAMGALFQRCVCDHQGERGTGGLAVNTLKQGTRLAWRGFISEPSLGPTTGNLLMVEARCGLASPLRSFSKPPCGKTRLPPP